MNGRSRAMRTARIAAAVVAVAACDRHARPPEPEVRAALADSVPWTAGGEGGTLHRIAVRTAARADTVPGVVTDVAPVAAGGAVLGFGSDPANGALQYAFRYDLRRRTVEHLPTPGDVDPRASAPAISPDGRHLAYVAVDRKGGRMRAVVRRWPAGPIEASSPWISVVPRDSPVNQAAWTSADAFDVRIDLGRAWARVQGSIHRHIVRVDTVPR